MSSPIIRPGSKRSPRPTSTASPASTSRREKMAILVVGDRSQIEGPLKSLPFVETIQRLDTEGNSVTRPCCQASGRRSSRLGNAIRSERELSFRVSPTTERNSSAREISNFLCGVLPAVRVAECGGTGRCRPRRA